MKTRNLWIAQSVLIAGGTIFAWNAVVTDFLRFYRTEGTIFKISDCIYPNPITTPCFWGAVLFAVLLILTVRLHNGTEILGRQRRILTLLVVGTLFAWGNFLWGIRSFYSAPSGEGTSCSGVPVDSPLHTACFYGALFFTASLIAGFFYLRALRKSDRI
ncbi:MAG: hypothetical protein A2675_00790 [Candidatus Yonathbacteria bacterium RIFCSPHIGHO2_01_FULL_51_10]|uniref:Vitamin K epoxide reductase domain-containing protein n=1 Tax=Candidatus Yonathbacteria bacterium RIFCSPHIGHO2_01_FULL_51_10 TaxID=1802723 RepID=A0A1G2S7K6_9BACT|nr:MAG: hypothetical protein A2675_00790 [Candidatus Yonathbacteria bacterium RIFCSPHIGHO2_01_FULL_51_10]